jgi:hypothetical protein
MSTADKIIELKELLDCEAITPEEYEQLKKEILTGTDSKDPTIATPTNSNSLSVEEPVDKQKSIAFRIGKVIRKHPVVAIASVVAIVYVVVLIANYDFEGNKPVQLSGTTWSYVYPSYREGSNIDRELYPEGETRTIRFYDNPDTPDGGRGYSYHGGAFEWTLASERKDMDTTSTLTLLFTDSMQEEQYEVRYAEGDSGILWAYSYAELHLPNVYPSVWKLQ